MSRASSSSSSSRPAAGRRDGTPAAATANRHPPASSTAIHPDPVEVSSAAKPPRLLDQVRGRIRALRYSIRTEQAYVDWIRRYILFHGKRHPLDMGPAEVTAFLTHLAVERRVSAFTQNQAKAALLFLYGQVLEMELSWLDEGARRTPTAGCWWC